MAGRKRGVAKRKPGNNSMAQLGLMDLPDLSDISNMGIDDDDDDESGDDEGLEDELMALLSGKSQPKITKRAKPPGPGLMDIDKLAAECMKEIDSEDENDENLSEDEELMSELEAIVPEPTSPSKQSSPPSALESNSSASIINALEERLTQYKIAESTAKSLGDNLKAKRFSRGIKTLEGLINSAKSGHNINEEDIPPQVAIPKNKIPEKSKSKQNTISPENLSSKENSEIEENKERINQEVVDSKLKPINEPHPQLNKDTSQNSDISLLNERKNQYKLAALNAKKSGDTNTAIKYVKIAKQFDNVISALENGQPVDLKNMPPPPPGYQEKISAIANKTEPSQNVPQENEQLQNLAMEMANEPNDPSLFNAPPPPTTIMEALEQRLEKFRSTLETAKSEGNNSKVRRVGRIIKQYEDAIKRYKSGKPVDFEELATPPGFGPIPKEDNQKEESLVTPSRPIEQKTSVNKPPIAPSRPAPSRPSPPKPNEQINTKNIERNPKLSARSSSFVLEKQLNFLLERQKLFKKAALESKNKGDIQQAKEYLRMSKGIDPMIEATRNGLPIDATSIPTPPQIQEDYVIVEKSDCINVEEKGSEDLYSKLETDLINQIEICQRNKDHFLKLGDVSSASKFEKLAHSSRKDLDVIKHLWKLGESLPRFHYETRLFSMVQCNTDLIDTDFEITVERGINLPGKPTELDSYVKIEFPFPSDNPQKAKTHTVRDTNNPEYKETFKFKIDRKSRSLARIFKRQPVKLEVWSRGGIFRSDVLLGTSNIKLTDLEKKCTIHDSFEVMEGRKTTGGKLEVKLCIRDPLLVKQVEEVRERWLVIGS